MVFDLALGGAGPEELQGYLEALMAKLLEVVRTGNSDTQETALGAIASAANAAGSSFQPYVAAVFPVLRQYMEVRLPVLCLLVPVVAIASWTQTLCTVCSVCLASFLSHSFTNLRSCSEAAVEAPRSCVLACLSAVCMSISSWMSSDWNPKPLSVWAWQH